MDLAITGNLVTRAVEDHTGVMKAILAGNLFEDRAGMNKDAVASRQRLHGGISRPFPEDFRSLLLVSGLTAEKVETFRLADPSRPFVGYSLFDQLAGRGDIRRLVLARIHLDQTDLHAPSSRASRTKSIENTGRNPVRPLRAAPRRRRARRREHEPPAYRDRPR